MGKELQGIRLEQTEAMTKRKPDREDDSREKEEVRSYEMKLLKMKQDMKILSEAATEILLEKDEAVNHLKKAIREVGDPQYRILNLVLERRTIKVDEIATQLLLDTAEVLDIVDSLQALGEVILKDNATVIPAKKYREVKVPVEEWRSMSPPAIFESLEEIVEKSEGTETIAEALERAVDILEQKLTRGGALVFQMRKTAGSWGKSEGDREELRYTIREWKSRALSLA
jgi:hypothetical protein